MNVVGSAVVVVDCCDDLEEDVGCVDCIADDDGRRLDVLGIKPWEGLTPPPLKERTTTSRKEQQHIIVGSIMDKY
jgi:hypothetical protein